MKVNYQKNDSRPSLDLLCPYDWLVLFSIEFKPEALR